MRAGSPARWLRRRAGAAARAGRGASDRAWPQSESGALAAWLAPARDASSAVRDVEVLRGVVWEAALGELRQPAPGQVADLSDRLAYVCAALVAALLEPPRAGACGGRPGRAVRAPGASACSTARRERRPADAARC